MTKLDLIQDAKSVYVKENPYGQSHPELISIVERLVERTIKNLDEEVGMLELLARRIKDGMVQL